MTARGQIIFIDTVHFDLRNKLLDEGFDCVDVASFSKDEIIENHSNALGIIVRSRFPINQDFLQHFPKLKFIGRFGAGMENIDVAYAKANGIHCLRAPEGNMTAVAEQAIGMLLALMHRVIISSKEVAQGKWRREENRGVELEGKTVGIIGYGYMGKAFAHRLKSFGCKVLVYDKYIEINNPELTQVSLKEIQKMADIISLHLPLSKETINFVDEAFINAMDKPFYIINTARGQHVSSEALLKGLQEEKILGACLDVLDREKSSFEGAQQDAVIQQLIARENVIITPHIAGWSKESNEKMANALFQKITAL